MTTFLFLFKRERGWEDGKRKYGREREERSIPN
jgi:hypothetical protein